MILNNNKCALSYFLEKCSFLQSTIYNEKIYFLTKDTQVYQKLAKYRDDRSAYFQ